MAQGGNPIRYVAYYRVSTARQGRSGLGLDAQQEAAQAHVRGTGAQIIAEFTEVETGKGANALARRPQLRAALAEARKLNATLLIAKLDRLARNVAFIAALMESRADFVCCDMPQANKLTIQIMAAVAEHERDMISQRTKAALAAAKARGPVFSATHKRYTYPLGATGADRARENKAKALVALAPIAPAIMELVGRSLTRKQIAAELNTRGIASPGGGNWHPSSVHKALARLETLAGA